MSMHGWSAYGSVSWLGLLFLGLFVWFVVRILHKAGYSGWWVLLMFVPVVNLVAVWLFAFADWPGPRGDGTPAAPGWGRSTAARLRELDSLRRQGLISEAEHAERRKAILDAV